MSDNSVPELIMATAIDSLVSTPLSFITYNTIQKSQTSKHMLRSELMIHA